MAKLSQLALSGNRLKTVDGNMFAHMPSKTTSSLPFLLSQFHGNDRVTHGSRCRNDNVIHRYQRDSFVATFFSFLTPLRPNETAPPWQPVGVWLQPHLLGAMDGADQGHPVTSGGPEVRGSSGAPKQELLQPPSWQTDLPCLTPKNMDEDHSIGWGGGGPWESDDKLLLKIDFFTLYVGFEKSFKKAQYTKLQCSQ